MVKQRTDMIIESKPQGVTETLVHQLTEGRLTYLKQCAKAEIKKSRVRIANANTVPPEPEDVVNSVIEAVLMGWACKLDGVSPTESCIMTMSAFLDELRELIAHEVNSRVLRATANSRAVAQWKKEQASFASIEIDPDL